MKNIERGSLILVLVLVFGITFWGVSELFAQQDALAISLLEKKVQLFENFFSSKPKILEKQSDKRSATGYIFFYDLFDNCTISYDVQKTDSLVSPYMGYITVKYPLITSNRCGDFRSGTESFFTTIELARQKRDDESCYTDTTYGSREPVIMEAKFIFAFQKNQWVFKEILNTYNNKPDPVFSTAFGSPMGGRFYVEDNDFWKRLIE